MGRFEFIDLSGGGSTNGYGGYGGYSKPTEQVPIVQVDISSTISIISGGEKTVKGSVKPSTNDETLEWTVSKGNAAYVSLYPNADGRTCRIVNEYPPESSVPALITITVTTEHSRESIDFDVNLLVEPVTTVVPVSSITFDGVTDGGTTRIQDTNPGIVFQALVAPSNATTPGVVWSTDTPSVLRIVPNEEDGLRCMCIPVKRGTAKITATTVGIDSSGANLSVHYTIIVIGPDTYYGEKFYRPESVQDPDFPADKLMGFTVGSSWSSGWFFPGGIWRYNNNISLSTPTENRHIGMRMVRKPKTPSSKSEALGYDGTWVFKDDFPNNIDVRGLKKGGHFKMRFFSNGKEYISFNLISDNTDFSIEYGRMEHGQYVKDIAFSQSGETVGAWKEEGFKTIEIVELGFSSSVSSPNSDCPLDVVWFAEQILQRADRITPSKAHSVI